MGLRSTMREAALPTWSTGPIVGATALLGSVRAGPGQPDAWACRQEPVNAGGPNPEPTVGAGVHGSRGGGTAAPTTPIRTPRSGPEAVRSTTTVYPSVYHRLAESASDVHGWRPPVQGWFSRRTRVKRGCRRSTWAPPVCAGRWPTWWAAVLLGTDLEIRYAQRSPGAPGGDGPGH